MNISFRGAKGDDASAFSSQPDIKPVDRSWRQDAFPLGTMRDNRGRLRDDDIGLFERVVGVQLDMREHRLPDLVGRRRRAGG